jgi:protein-disulfide isomerase
MSEENVTNNPTPAPAPTPAVVVAPVTAASSIQLRDMLIPISIVIAGICVGAGLFLSGGAPNAAQPVEKVGQAGTPEAPADTTQKVDPVTEKDHIKGKLSAPVKIVEYSDFECPFCKSHHKTLQAILDKYGEDKIAWVYRQFPLEQLHKKAMPVAMASECVAELGGDVAFWKFTDGYFEQTLTNDRTDIDTLIPKLVATAGVNSAKFTECFESNRHQEAINADMADAAETGGRGTPWAIVIGPSGKTYPINGAQPQAAIEQIIETALKEG